MKALCSLSKGLFLDTPGRAHNKKGGTLMAASPLLSFNF